MTAQEVITFTCNKLDVIVLIINNNGYTIERLIHGPEQHYNDPIFRASVDTWERLDAVLHDKDFKDGRGLRIVELKLDTMDCTQHMSDFSQT
ncbi:pyruvate decarboxylase [Penicillium maclennaniae]|uniref:pyruvate decarboxylase n=1 Tax=Penicillium maclennaniae TaxID=1343394 RepID=UPI002541CE44|nr:pyruvate decarboxylase [Penicillium maclennaniae]KAJ5667719.1 pyruvate decarboxylase [Penicillium maclennaniae]